MAAPAAAVAAAAADTPTVTPEHHIRIPGDTLRAFCKRALMAAGAGEPQAEACADLLVCADERGVHSHGVNRLEIYTEELKHGNADGKADPTIDTETVAIARVNGNNAVGAHVGRFCMELAIRKAKEVGIGMVVAHASNHYGMAGYWSMMALKHGMIGMSFTNSSPCMVPTGARVAAIGTNPISLAAPSADGNPMVLDMATTTVPLGKIEVHHRQGKPILPGWGVDYTGAMTTDAEAILFGGGLCPLGGAKETGGYKGYGLAMMVEVLTSLLAGAAFGPKVQAWRKGRSGADVGQCYIAINPSAFGPGFPERMAEMAALMHGLPLAAGATEVMVPGEPEARRTADSLKHGVMLHENVVAALNKLAASLGVEPLTV